MGTSNAKTLNLQDSFLNKVRAEKKTIVIYLLNGFQVRGKVWGFDNFTVIIDCDGRQELICDFDDRPCGGRIDLST